MLYFSAHKWRMSASGNQIGLFLNVNLHILATFQSVEQYI